MRFIVRPIARSNPNVVPNPTSNPPFIGGQAKFQVTTNFTGGSPCGLNINIGGAVTGVNATNATLTGSNPNWTISWVGQKPGKDHVKITISVAGCTGTDYRVTINGGDTYTPFEADVGWGNNWRKNGTCDGTLPEMFLSPVYRSLWRDECVEDPIDEGQGDYQSGSTDLVLRAPGIPFEMHRTYNSLEGSVLSEFGHGWRTPYASFLSIDTSSTPNKITAMLGTGQRIIFTKSGSAWLAESWTTATLTLASNVYALTLADQTQWRFNSSGVLTNVLDPNGVGLTIAGSINHPNTVTTSNGRVVTFTWGSSTGCSFGVLKKVALPDGRNVTYSYGAGCQLTSVVDARGGTTSYTYDTYGRLIEETDPRGNACVTNTYDDWGHVASQADALNNVTSYSWSPGPFVAYDYYASDDGFPADAPAWAAAQRSTVTDARGNRWIDAFTWDGSIIGQQDPLGHRTSRTFDSNDLPSSYTDPLGNTVAYSVDAQQDVTAVTAPGTQTTTTYDSKRNPLTVTDGRNNTTTYTYDANGDVLTATAADGTVLTFTYNGSGQLLTATDERGKTTIYTYDANGYLASKTTPTGAKTTYGYDSSGRLTSSVDPRGNVGGANPNDYKTTYGYDAADELTSAVDPLGHTTAYTYDANGNLTSKTDPNGRTWAYAYDADDRLTTVISPDLSTTTFGYDAVGNLTSRTDANGHTTAYTYDAANRLIGRVDPLNRHWVYGYDAASNLISVTTPSGGTVTSGYDALGRRTTVRYSDGTPSVAFGYDANGNRTSMTDGTGSVWSYGYDQRDRLTGVTHGADSFAYTYDSAGNSATRTYPDSTVTTYGYDDGGLLTSATTGAATASYQYDPAAELTRTSFPNGVVETAAYDRAGRVTSRDDGFRAFGYGYDPAGNVTSRTIGSAVTTYGYDALDRLTSVSGPGGSIAYAYDGVGNRTSLTDGSGSTAYTYDAADELTSASGPGGTTSYAYDDNGNEASAGAWTYSFDPANELTSATDGVHVVAYTFDGDGNRVSATSGGVASSLVWDGNFDLPQLALERDSSGGLIRRYGYGVGRISMTTAGTTASYSTDPLGTVTDLSDAAGTNVGAYDTNPFGDGLAATGLGTSVQDNPFVYTGEYSDPITGLYDLRARQYDPATGRFLSLDPLAPQDYASPYAYVANNPLAFIDPSGARRHACSGLGCLRRWASDPNNLWDSIRYSGAAAACYDGGEVGARAGILGAAIGCLAVTTAFDISAEHAREKIHDLGGD